jgi:hypothetical protein
MLSCQIIDSCDPLWNIYLYSFPEVYHDINYSSQYHQVMEAKGDGKPELFIAEENGKLYFHPYMIKQIKNIGKTVITEEIYDIQSVFGYTGPIVNTNDSNFINIATRLFENVSRERKIIVEFIRFNPLLRNHLSINSAPNLEVILLKEYVYVNLMIPEDQIFRKYHSKLRENLHSAGRDHSWDLVISKEKDFYCQVVSLIEDHLRFLRVDKYYHGTTEYYDRLYQMVLANGQVFGAIEKESGELLSGEIFVFDKGTVYYLHTAYKSRDPRTSSIHKLLIHKAFIYFQSKGFCNVCFGGGVSNSPEDSLIKYKKKFSGYTENFYIGKRILNTELYDKVNGIWEKEYPHLIEKRNNLVLKYRFSD